MVADTLVDPFVMPADQQQVVFQGKLIGCLLVECFPIRCEVDDLVVDCFFLQGFDGIHQRFDHQHHAGATAECVIIHLGTGIGGMVPQVDHGYFQQAFFPGSFQDRMSERSFQQAGHYGDDVYFHTPIP